MSHHDRCPAKLNPGYGVCDCAAHDLRENTAALNRVADQRTNEEQLQQTIELLTERLAGAEKLAEDRLTWGTDVHRQFVQETGRTSDLMRERDEAKLLFEKHTKAVADFLNELYAIMVDPLADGTKQVSEIRTELIKTATADREIRVLVGMDTPWPAPTLYKALVVAEQRLRDTGRDFDGWESIQSAASVAQARLSTLPQT